MTKTTKQLLKELISSPDYASRLPPNSTIQVRAVYLTLLNREPTQVEYQTDASTVQQSGYQGLVTKLFNSGVKSFFLFRNIVKSLLLATKLFYSGVQSCFLPGGAINFLFSGIVKTLLLATKPPY